MVENSSNGVYIFDDHSLKLQQSNDRARSNSSYPRIEINQLCLDKRLSELRESQFKDIVNGLYSGDYNEQLISTNIRRKNGSSYPIKLSLQLSAEADHNLLLAIAQDITKRKQAYYAPDRPAKSSTIYPITEKMLVSNQQTKNRNGTHLSFDDFGTS